KAPIQPAAVQTSQTASQNRSLQMGVSTQPAQKTSDIGLNNSLFKIANELELIRKLLELYIKPPQFTTAAHVLTEDDIIEQYGVPPEETKEINDNKNINKDGLPNIF
ncbi:MAG: hypothetical protein ACFFG0_34280, partial [Candidatus Thorarchaeota archaeon]